MKKKTTLAEFTEMVGSSNVDTILGANSLTRTKHIGKAFDKLCKSALYPVDSSGQTIAAPNISIQRKKTLLDGLTDSSDVFETAALQSEQGWILLSELGVMPELLKIPETVKIPDSNNVIGNEQAVSRTVYAKTLQYIEAGRPVDPGIFETSPSVRGAVLQDSSSGGNVMQWFNLPWGDITLYSSLSDSYIDFPVYPQGIKDGVSSNYDTMPEMLYQYEPVQVYKSTGPRAITYTFHMHRDMWSGDHRDGKCSELIRFCQSNCYPSYNGAAVNTARVKLYIKGQPHISGIMTNTEWQFDENSPIGLDGMPLEVSLSITIVEISEYPLNYEVIRQKGLIA